MIVSVSVKLLFLLWAAACALLVLVARGTLGTVIDLAKHKVKNFIYWLKGKL